MRLQQIIQASRNSNHKLSWTWRAFLLRNYRLVFLSCGALTECVFLLHLPAGGACKSLHHIAQRRVFFEDLIMPSIPLTQDHHVDVEPTRMHILEMLEKRRFSLSVLCTVALLSSFSDAFTNYQYKMSVQMLSNKAIYLLQSLM